ncbi:hypothetical protein EAD96_18920 [Micromonospora sp. BL1]|uniref:Lipoprotein n=1 Tax=Micromonospora sp. HUAS YX12 TaxID=3156396 RepID=A0AAU7QW88_9ACTN|nr:hypothetical protein [Micromonospora sp. BL1]NED50685.1 hypothetical protein [Micromonospora aurantiaca]RLQ03547.1 hypothetical protein EAD96_18920 [Micromonospora sp. BL1]
MTGHPRRAARLAASALAVAVSIGSAGCGRDEPDPARSGPLELDRLTAPAELAGLPRQDTGRDKLPPLVDGPPGLAVVINGYGEAIPPPLTLEAYYGNPVGITAVGRALQSRLGGGTAAPGAETTCHSGADGSITCWRRADTLVVTVTARDGRSAERTRDATEQAWEAVTG